MIDQSTLNLLWGTTTETHDTVNDTRIQFLHGNTFERSNYTFTFEYTKRDPLRAGDYPNFDEETDYPYQDRDTVLGDAIPNRMIYCVNEWDEYFGFDSWYYDPAAAPAPTAY